MRLDNGIEVDIQERNIGPAYDPYGATTVFMSRNGVEAQRYHDGLGRESVTVMKDKEIVAHREWFHDYSKSGKNKNKCNKTYAELVVRRHLGMSIQQAQDEYNRNWVEDPMGSLGNYC